VSHARPLLAVSHAGLMGGAERLLLAVAASLDEPPLIACPEGPLAEAARERGLGVFELREHSLELRRNAAERAAAGARVAARAAELRPLVSGTRPRALLAWGMRAEAALCAAFPRTGTPILFQHNDLLPGPLLARLVRACAARSQLVIAPSAGVASDLDPGGALAGRLHVIHPGVDLERFAPSPSGTGSTEVLLLGAVEPWKRPDLALEAVALAARELPELRLRLAGEPIGSGGTRLLADLRRRAAAPDLAGRVEFAGVVERPEQALAGAACLLHCAEREPYGMVVAEALSAGVPVVAPDAYGPSELVEPSCGRLYAPGDAAAAARALVEVLGDPDERARFASGARARAERDLGTQAMLSRYEELLAPADRARRRARPAARGGELAIVTVLHDSERELPGLLASVERHLPDAQVVVVDSGSSDDGPELARRWRGGLAQVLELGENAGFGRGVNEGVRLVERPVTVLLNPDCELLDASLAAAGREALASPPRLLAPLVLRPGGEREDNAQREPGSAPLVLHALVPGAVLPRRVAAAVEPWRSRGPSRAGWATGSCVVARTETLRALGPFDQHAFMYAEDLDLGLRAADAGIETWFWPAARVNHAGAHASARAFGGEPFDLLARRRREVVSERRGGGAARRDELLLALTYADRMLLKRLTGRDGARERRQLEALLAARRDEGGA
jgi:glycosyltransferase involved in cell wall biosynthesis/GT2 family glycosyltransferase